MEETPTLLRASSTTAKATLLTSLFSRMYRSGTVRTIAFFATGNTVAMILGVVGSLVQARYVIPDDLGIFRSFSIVVGYITFLHLGVFDGLRRELPIQLGRGNRARAECAASACLAWIKTISLASATVFLGLALWSACGHRGKWFWGWLAYVPCVAATFYGGYLGTTFRSDQQFAKLSNANVLQAVAATLVLPLFPILGYYAACLRTAVSSATNLLFLHRWRPLKVRPRLDWQSTWEVVRIGLPLGGAGYLSTSLWLSVEGTLVLKWFGLKMLGLYSFAVFVRTLTTQLAQNVNQVLGVKIFEQYGRSSRAEDCLRLLLKPMVIAVLASLLLVGAGWFVLPWVVVHLTPNYVEAVFMMQLMLLTMPLVFLRLPVGILIATARQIDLFVSVVAGLFVFVSFSYLLRELDLGVLSVVIATMVGQVTSLVTIYLLVARLILKEKQTMAGKRRLYPASRVQA